MDGIHFDDYFYHAPVGYKKRPGSTTSYSRNIPAARKRYNVNKLVKSVYRLCHKKENTVFGISPQGDYDSAMSSGADVKKWMSKNGYVDYVVPQIYWTNDYGSGHVKLFDQRLKQFTKIWKNDTKLYIGLALYLAGRSLSRDHGWAKSNNVLKTQVKKLRKEGCDGFIMFSGECLYQSASKKERSRLVAYLKKHPR